MGIIERFEAEFDTPSSKWKLAQWREVAQTLAKQIDDANKPKKRGPKGPRNPGNIAKLSHQAQCKKDNAAAGITEETDWSTVGEGEYQRTIRSGSVKLSTVPAKRITLKEAIRRVMVESGELSTRNGRPVSNTKVEAKLEANIKQVQLFRRKQAQELKKTEIISAVISSVCCGKQYVSVHFKRNRYHDATKTNPHRVYCRKAWRSA